MAAHTDLCARAVAALTFPLTTDELVSQLDEFSKPVRETIVKLHRRGQIHIEGWDVTGGQPRARWVAGPGTDAARPRRSWIHEEEAA